MEAELDELFGETFCKYFSHEFVKKYLRVDLSTKEFDKVIVEKIAAEGDLDRKLLSSSFWINLTDELDSRFTVERCSIKAALKWQVIAERFFTSICTNYFTSNCDDSNVKKLNSVVSSIFKRKKFESTEKLLEYLSNGDNSDPSSEDLDTRSENVENCDDKTIEEKADDEINKEPETVIDAKKKLTTTIEPSYDSDTISEISLNVVDDDSDLTEDASSNDQTYEIAEQSSYEVSQTNEGTRKRAKTGHSDDGPAVKSRYFQKNPPAALNNTAELILNVLNPKSTPKGVKNQFRNKVKLTGKNKPLNDSQDTDGWFEFPESDNEGDVVPPDVVARFRLSQRHSKKSYSTDEDHKILKYLISHKAYGQIKGIQIWKEMETDKICPGRSWQSMKERYRKNIAPNLSLYSDAFHIDSKVIESLQAYSFYGQGEQEPSSGERAVKLYSSNYSLEEDEEIINFIFRLEDDEAILGKSIWIKLERHFKQTLKRVRTWQSLKERFLKRIIPKIYNYNNLPSLDRTLQIVDQCVKGSNEQNEIKQKVRARLKKA